MNIKPGTPEWTRWRRRHVDGLEKSMERSRLICMGIAVCLSIQLVLWVVTPERSSFATTCIVGALVLDFIAATLMLAVAQRTVMLIHALTDEDNDLMGRYIRVGLDKHTMALFLLRNPWDLYDD